MALFGMNVREKEGKEKGRRRGSSFAMHFVVPLSISQYHSIDLVQNLNPIH